MMAATMVGATGVYHRLVEDRLRLTRCEKRILLLHASGMDAAQIAEKEFITVGTVHKHTENARAKFAAASTWQAYMAAVADGQLPCPCCVKGL